MPSVTIKSILLSTLDVGMLVFAMQLHSIAKWPNLKLKTRLKQLLGSLPLAFVLPHLTFELNYNTQIGLHHSPVACIINVLRL
jgi:hypothetical protein